MCQRIDQREKESNQREPLGKLHTISAILSSSKRLFTRKVHLGASNIYFHDEKFPNIPVHQYVSYIFTKPAVHLPLLSSYPHFELQEILPHYYWMFILEQWKTSFALIPFSMLIKHPFHHLLNYFLHFYKKILNLLSYVTLRGTTLVNPDAPLSFPIYQVNEFKYCRFVSYV